MDSADCPLTPRQLQVLGMVARGLLLRSIAHHLCLGEQAVKNDMWHLKERLGAQTPAQAVYIALTHGWIK